MSKFYCETKDNTSSRLVGPIDPKSGWPTVHASLHVEADSVEEAKAKFEKLFPKNVLEVYSEP